MAGGFKISADALRDIRVDGKRVASATLPDDAQRVEAAVLMQIFYRK